MACGQGAPHECAGQAQVAVAAKCHQHAQRGLSRCDAQGQPGGMRVAVVGLWVVARSLVLWHAQAKRKWQWPPSATNTRSAV